jgi:hypothetical protein
MILPACWDLSIPESWTLTLHHLQPLPSVVEAETKVKLKYSKKALFPKAVF